MTDAENMAVEIVRRETASARLAYPQYAARDDAFVLAMLASHRAGLGAERTEGHNLNSRQAQRIASLELGRFAADAVEPRLVPAHWRAIGRRIRRRVFAAWPRRAPTLEAYRSALISAGHSKRGADQFGALLAMADMALHGGDPDGDTLAGWAAQLSAAKVLAASDEGEDWQAMLNHVLTQRADAYRSGVQHTVGELVAAAAGLPGGADSFGSREADTHLRRIGLCVEREGQGWEADLVLANKHAGLQRLFAETRWANGVWRQSARRVPGARAPETVRTQAGGRMRVTAIPMISIREYFEQAPVERQLAEALAARRTEAGAA